MWLPREERHLLMVYEVCIPKLGEEGVTFALGELSWFATYTSRLPLWRAWKIAERAKQLKKTRRDESGEFSPRVPAKPGSGEKDCMAWLAGKEAVESANKMLTARDLIELRENGTGIYAVTLKLEGRDLARKYNSWWDRTGLWYNDRIRHHWIWLIISFAIGALGTLVVQWLSG